MDRITNTHVYFWGSPLSNWQLSEFEYKDLIFYNSEQAFMWEKAMYFKDGEVADAIFEEEDPKKAKDLGRMVRNFVGAEWSKVSYQFMVDINYAKFSTNDKLRKLLLFTKDKTLVESSPFDKIWGVGIHWKDDDILSEGNWKGTNLFGKALMEVRKMLKNNK